MSQQHDQHLLHLSSETVRVITADQILVLNLREHIVTLLARAQARILAQSRFPPNAFRALILLLTTPDGASYAHLLASLQCSEEVLGHLLTTQVSDPPVLAALVTHWQAYLAQVTRQREDPGALERELRVIRWAVKGKRGIEPIAKQAGFGWRVHALPRHGYLLLRSPGT
jgi:hypothetical protein